MALITCPECGNKISTKADFCPQCGWKVTFKNNIGNYHYNANVKNYSGASHPSDNRRINLTAILITIIIALAAIACIAMLRKGKDKTSPTNTTEKVDTLMSKTSNGWQYEEYETDGSRTRVASILSDDETMTIKLITNGSHVPNSVLVVINDGVVPNFKDDKYIGLSINNTKHWCEFQRDEEAESPTYKIAINNDLYNDFINNNTFSLFFNTNEIKFSSPNSLNMPLANESSNDNQTNSEATHRQNTEQNRVRESSSRTETRRESSFEPEPVSFPADHDAARTEYYDRRQDLDRQDGNQTKPDISKSDNPPTPEQRYRQLTGHE